MKTLVLVCVLAVAIVVYADQKDVDRYYNIYEECAKQLGQPVIPATSDAIICALKKNTQVIDGQGAVIKAQSMSKYGQLISDPTKLKAARDIASKCIDDAQKGPGTPEEQTLKIVECALPTVYLIDKKST